MSRYVTPLPGMLARTIEYVLARAAALDEAAERKLAPLAGRWLKFDLQGLEIELWLSAEGPAPIVLAEPEREDLEPDTEVAGTPASLLAMALPDLDADGRVRIEGDARLAQQFQQAMRALDPDIEKALTESLGEIAGPQIYRFIRETAEAAAGAARTGGEQFTQWLREESRLTPSPAEWRAFRDGVDELRERVDRLESRLKRRAQ